MRVAARAPAGGAALTRRCSQNKSALAEKKGPPPYRCGVQDCKRWDQNYASRKALMNHMLWHTTPPDAFIMCDFDGCKTNFPNKTMLEKHKKDSHAATEWPCSCGKTFKHRTSLTYHCKRKAANATPEADAAPEPHVAQPPKPVTK